MKIRSRLGIKKQRSFFSALMCWSRWVSGFCAVVTLLLGAMLFSYNPYDPSWFYYSSQALSTHNIAGVLGAHIAAFCFFMLGNGAYLLLGLGLYFTYCFARNRSLKDEIDRGFAFVTLIPAWCAILYAFKWGATAYLIPGGQLGSTVFRFMNESISFGGSIALLYGIVICQLLLISRISLIEAFVVVKRGATTVPYFYTIFKKLLRLFLWLFVQIRYYAQKIERVFFTLISHQNNQTQQEQSFAAPVMPTQQPVFEEHETDHQEEQLSLYASEKKIPVVPTTKAFKLPSASLFTQSEKGHKIMSAYETKQMATILEEKLARFGIAGTVIDVKQGPVVTLFEYQPAIETKLSKIVSLDQDLALALQAMSVRIIAPIPGTARVGFEVSNKERVSVLLGDVMRSSAFQTTKATLPLILGKDTTGNAVVVDLADMPHLLVAGSTGSGKSIALNTMILSLISSLTPQQLSLIIIDPKRLEFAAYQHIPHLLFPIITDPHRAAPILRWLVKHMEERYQIMAELNVRNIGEYKTLCAKEVMHDALPYTVVLIDELADLMMVAGKESEQALVRLAQMARAAGIHLIVATQRPSVDVITGLIKVNFPSRISFRLTSKIDSRTILDSSGAESLLGKGDMLFMDVHSSRICRVHGAYVSDVEIKRVADMVRFQQKPNYKDLQEAIAECQTQYGTLPDDPLLKEVVVFLNTVSEISISLLQRRFKIGYNRSARLMELLEQQGKIMPADGSKMRKVVR